jgi:hypothetical protein
MNYKELEELVWRLSKVAKDAYAEWKPEAETDKERSLHHQVACQSARQLEPVSVTQTTILFAANSRHDYWPKDKKACTKRSTEKYLPSSTKHLSSLDNLK